ncbi:uncharacterized protein LOC111339768 [Stylophora pistillata]|uniref:uncharacterized protein LOC111339768 n=1 Tax=Stylophora pistillata TaxID=50429 RepID=UPI000C056ED0|nr:uncharacterized protein LOC111339768 [Stylophora pistillata]
MAASSLFIYAAALVLFIVPAASSLQCYDCSSLPQVTGGTSCSADTVKKLTCPPVGFDRCFTMKVSIQGQTFETRNCSSSLVCDSQINPCSQSKDQGIDCSFECCKGDLCNDGVGDLRNNGVGLALSLGALFSALILPKVLGFN